MKPFIPGYSFVASVTLLIDIDIDDEWDNKKPHTLSNLAKGEFRMKCFVLLHKFGEGIKKIKFRFNRILALISCLQYFSYH